MHACLLACTDQSIHGLSGELIASETMTWYALDHLRFSLLFARCVLLRPSLNPMRAAAYHGTSPAGDPP